MRRFGALFDTVASSSNLWSAWREFRRGKRNRPSVRRFEFEADRHVVRLHGELALGRYQPGAYELVGISEPKRRLIAAASVRDRVVHHAVHRVLAPRLNKSLIDTTYACLPGRGSHRAILAFVAALRRYRWVLCLDIRHYFLSIDRTVLGALLARRIKDRRLFDLLGVIAESGAGLYRYPGVAEFLQLNPGFPPVHCGLPIGNLTSQWWGNFYLSGLDHFVKRELHIPHYQRYMDDVALFSDSRHRLEDARQAVGDWLWNERRLRLKKPGAVPKPSGSRFTYLGYSVRRAGASPTRSALLRLERRIRELVLRGDVEKIRRSVASYRGLLQPF